MLSAQRPIRCLAAAVTSNEVCGQNAADSAPQRAKISAVTGNGATSVLLSADAALAVIPAQVAQKMPRNALRTTDGDRRRKATASANDTDDTIEATRPKQTMTEKLPPGPYAGSNSLYAYTAIAP